MRPPDLQYLEGYQRIKVVTSISDSPKVTDEIERNKPLSVRYIAKQAKGLAYIKGSAGNLQPQTLHTCQTCFGNLTLGLSRTSLLHLGHVKLTK